MDKKPQQSPNTQQNGQQDSVRDGATDRGGTGGYGASLGFSGVTESGRDQYSASDRVDADRSTEMSGERGRTDQSSDRDVDLDRDPDRDTDGNVHRETGMRGRETGRSDSESVR